LSTPDQNSVILHGKIVEPPRVKTHEQFGRILSFLFETRTETDTGTHGVWHQIIVRRALALKLEDRVKVGSRLHIQGYLDYYTEMKSNSRRASIFALEVALES
jgi:single-stranded DNA-binding protein